MNPFGSQFNMDPFAQMNQLMNSTFPMQSSSFMNSHQSMHNALMPGCFGQPMMMPFNGFNSGMSGMQSQMQRSMNQMHRSMQQMQSSMMSMPSMNNMMMMGGNGSSSSFHQTVHIGGNGATKSYSMSSRTGPNGVRETRKTHRDSTTGMQKIEIGHHIGDRSHIVGRSRNTRTGEHERNQHFQNIDEEEAEEFNEEYLRRANSGFRGNQQQSTNQQPALTYRSTYTHPSRQ